MSTYSFEFEGQPGVVFYCNARCDINCYEGDNCDVDFGAVTVASVVSETEIRERDSFDDAAFWAEVDAIAAKHVEENELNFAELAVEREFCSVVLGRV
ncbi:hypothetical protein [Kordiimonas sp.]|uniref:hypothetical protein n=1 Tax=Kordiimonas sp. TaxID=1970157 RepID=UPI003A91783A